MSTSQLAGRQIVDGAVDNSKVAAGASIASSKLADGANWIKKDGSVAMTGNLDAGSQKIVNLATPSASGDAVNLAYLQAQIQSLNSLFDAKPSARAATTGNITISNPGTATFDGVTLSNGELLFVRAQTSQDEQGLYTFNGSSSALTRIDSMDAWTEIPGAVFAIEEGSTFADSMWLCTADKGGTLGTTAVTFQQLVIAGLQASNFIDKETPSGSVNGSNTSFVLANTPVSGSEHVFLNGMLQCVGSGNDYTISSATITMAAAPLTGERLLVSYRK